MTDKPPSKPEAKHFNQKPRRKAEFIKPLNILKSKVGFGGLSEEILTKAQVLLENNKVDFQPLADMYLNTMMHGVENAKDRDSGEDNEDLIAAMLYPAMQLKGNGGMFSYPLVTRIGDKLIQFLEVIEEPDKDALEIVTAFHTTIRAVLMGKVTGDGGKYGDELVQALDDACMRYFERYPNNHSDIEEDYSAEF